MGLSGRRTKQRIEKDPRNLSWADGMNLSFWITLVVSSSSLSQTDASRFGQAYLEKFGWDASKGLGVSGEGRTSAIKVTQKLDMLGIGVRQQSNLEGGIAWRQNRDFEDLLRRLNDGTTTETTNSTELLDSFHRAREPKSEAVEDGVVEKVKDDDGSSDGEQEREDVVAKKEKKKKKKKRKAAAEEEEVQVEEEEGLDRKERKKRRKKTSSSSRDDDDDGRAPVPSSHGIESEPPPPRPSYREAPPAEESGPVPMVTATATRPTAVTAPVPVRAPYVAFAIRGSKNQRLTYSIYRLFHHLSTHAVARARTAPASSQLSAWLRPTRPRSPRSSASHLPPLRPHARPPSLALSPILLRLLLLPLLPPQARRPLPTQLLPPKRKKTRCKS